jgi:predicted RNase H-like nuclease (RuvC/YqgF family)
MGRLIDADKLIAKIEEIYDGYMLSEDSGVVPKDFVEFLEEAPTVEAIPKADYENRIKADMATIKQLSNSIKALQKANSEIARAYDKLKKKIDSLEGNK